MRCFIFGSAPIKCYDYLKEFDFKDAFIICADGGVRHAKALGLTPDVWLGDGDSLKNDEALAKEYFSFPADKDNTDTDLAIELALERGCRKIVFVGCLGGRLDHEFSNLCLLKKVLESGAEGILVDEKNEITMKNRPFSLLPNDKKYVSFFPFGGDVTNFSVKGLRYSAKGLTLRCDENRASSNCFVERKAAEVSFDSGCVLVIRSND